MCVTATKSGDSLILDMTGTSPQAPGFINCTASGMRGAALTGLLPILAPTIRWNEGVMRAVTIVAPEGILSQRNVAGAGLLSGDDFNSVDRSECRRRSSLTLGRIFRRIRQEKGLPSPKGHMTVMTFAGRIATAAHSEPSSSISTAGGGGAYTDHDGLDGSGDYCVPRPAIANVEAERGQWTVPVSLSWVRPRYRRTRPDARRSWRFFGITPYETAGLHAMMLGHGVEVPNSIGQFGGLPGACGRNFIRRDAGGTQTIAGLAANLDAMLAVGVDELGPKPGHMALAAGDVLWIRLPGWRRLRGSDQTRSIGRSERRRQRACRRRGREFAIWRCPRGHAVDQNATRKQRDAIRGCRVGGALKKPMGAGDLFASEGRFVCSCGADLGPASGQLERQGPHQRRPLHRISAVTSARTRSSSCANTCASIAGRCWRLSRGCKTEASLVTFSLAV